MTTASSIAELRKQAKLPAAKMGGANVQRFFEANRETLAALLPKQMPVDRMLKLALGALRTTPKLMQCTTESLFGAVVTCAQLGLEPNTPLGHAYLIPFEKRTKQGGEWVTERTDVQVVIGYKGMLDLSRRSGQIVSIAAHEVRSNDDFTLEYGTEERLIHKPALSNRGDVIGFYAVAKLVGGGTAFEFMSREDVDAIRDASQGYKAAESTSKRTGRQADSPWHNNYIEMGRKTALRRLFKYLPISIEIASAIAVDDCPVTTPAALDDTLLSAEYTVEHDGHENEGATPQPAQPEATEPPASAEVPDPYDDWRLAFADCHTADDCGAVMASCKYSTKSEEFAAIRKICEDRKQAIAEAQA